MRNVSGFRLRAHILTVESSIWFGGNGHYDKYSCTAVKNEVHVFFTVKTCSCALPERSTRSFSSISARPFLWRPLIFCMPCLVRLSLISFLNGTTTLPFHLGHYGQFGTISRWHRQATNQSA